MFQKLYRILKYYYYQFVRLRATPEEVSRGLALGVFIGMTPTYGFQVAIAILLAIALKENKLAALIGVQITNPLTAVPIYIFNYKVGHFFIPVAAETLAFDPNLSLVDQVQKLADTSFDYLLAWVVGCLIVGAVSALLTYFISKPLYIYLRDRMRIYLEKKYSKNESSQNNS